MTPFGKYMRNLRIDSGKLLADVAEYLGVSSAYLSALEHGRKGGPSKDQLERIKEFFGLSAARYRELKVAVENSKGRIIVPRGVTPTAYETANEFARKLSSLSEEKLRRIREVLDK
jgi:transcriptional regulator with XRE-family HTH domain